MPVRCTVCKAEDSPVVDGFDSNMKPVLAHFVNPDPWPLDRSYITDQEKAQGWQFKVIDGKPAKWRYLCNNCLAKFETDRYFSAAIKRDLARQGDDRRLRESFFVQMCMLNE